MLKPARTSASNSVIEMGCPGGRVLGCSPRWPRQLRDPAYRTKIHGTGKSECGNATSCELSTPLPAFRDHPSERTPYIGPSPATISLTSLFLRE